MTPSRIDLRVRGPARLRGETLAPSDKSIAHRALVFAALASGSSRLRVRGLGVDVSRTVEALRALGVRVTAGADEVRVEGVGLDGLRAPGAEIFAGNSGTTMRLLTGLLAGQAFATTLDGDVSLRRRPMGRVVAPLARMGARIDGRVDGRGEVRAPLQILGVRGGERLRGIEHASSVPSAQVKSAILIAGLYADGPTVVREPVISRDHTERLLHGLGVPIASMGSTVAVDPTAWSREVPALDMEVPGDLSAAAFPLVATLATGSGPVVSRGVGVNPTRTGLLDVLRHMGAPFTVEPRGEAGGEPVADVAAEGAPDCGARVGGELLVRLVDEVPALVALAATVGAETEIRDAQELRVKESDRIGALVAVLREFGVEVDELADGLRLRGGGPRRAARVSSAGDHRIAMAGAVLGLATEGESIVEDVGCVATSFPGFVATMRALGVDIEEVRP